MAAHRDHVRGQHRPRQRGLGPVRGWCDAGHDHPQQRHRGHRRRTTEDGHPYRCEGGCREPGGQHDQGRRRRARRASHALKTIRRSGGGRKPRRHPACDTTTRARRPLGSLRLLAARRLTALCRPRSGGAESCRLLAKLVFMPSRDRGYDIAIVLGALIVAKTAAALGRSVTVACLAGLGTAACLAALGIAAPAHAQQAAGARRRGSGEQPRLRVRRKNGARPRPRHHRPTRRRPRAARRSRAGRTPRLRHPQLSRGHGRRPQGPRSRWRDRSGHAEAGHRQHARARRPRRGTASNGHARDPIGGAIAAAGPGREGGLRPGGRLHAARRHQGSADCGRCRIVGTDRAAHGRIRDQTDPVRNEALRQVRRRGRRGGRTQDLR